MLTTAHTDDARLRADHRPCGFFRRTVLLLLVALIGVLGVQSGLALGARQAPPAPTVTVKVDLHRVFADLEEARAARARLDAMYEEIAAHVRAEQAELKDMDERLAMLAPGAAEYRDLEGQMVMRLGALQGWQHAKMQLHETERRVETLRMYRRIVEAAAEMAKANGYDYIILTEPAFDFEREAPINDMLSEMFARRILYANDARDITADLITRMDNAFFAGR